MKLVPAWRAHARRLRSSGWSWNAIAAQLSEFYGWTFTVKSIRGWCRGAGRVTGITGVRTIRGDFLRVSNQHTVTKPGACHAQVSTAAEGGPGRARMMDRTEAWLRANDPEYSATHHSWQQPRTDALARQDPNTGGEK